MSFIIFIYCIKNYYLFENGKWFFLCKDKRNWYIFYFYVCYDEWVCVVCVYEGCYDSVLMFFK